MTLLRRRAGGRLTHITDRSGGPAVTDAVAGTTDRVIGSAAVLHPRFICGRLRPVAQMGAARLPGLAETPTMHEQRFEGLVGEPWWCVFAPARTPAPVIAGVHKALPAAFRELRVVETMTNARRARLVLAAPGEAGRVVARETKGWRKVGRENNIRPD